MVQGLCTVEAAVAAHKWEAEEVELAHSSVGAAAPGCRWEERLDRHCNILVNWHLEPWLVLVVEVPGSSPLVE